MILVREGYINLDLQQVDAENFNTDAYLLGMYEASLRKKKTIFKGNTSTFFFLSTGFQPKLNGNMQHLV